MCPASREKISEAKDVFWARRGQHWDPAKVLKEIRRLHRAGCRLSQQHMPARLYLGRRYFGTWPAAIQKAGLSYDEATGRRHWTRELVLEEIQAMAERGGTLSATYVEKHYPALYRAAVKRFPSSWAKALRAAGLDPAEHRMPRGRWDRQRAEGWVRTRMRKDKSILARDAPRDLVDFVHNGLGTGWINFVESLGIDYPGVRKRYDWTKRALVSEIRRWGAEGHRLNYRAVKLEYQALIHQARKFFGSWDRARHVAGV